MSKLIIASLGALLFIAAPGVSEFSAQRQEHGPPEVNPYDAVATGVAENPRHVLVEIRWFSEELAPERALVLGTAPGLAHHSIVTGKGVRDTVLRLQESDISALVMDLHGTRFFHEALGKPRDLPIRPLPPYYEIRILTEERIIGQIELADRKLLDRLYVLARRIPKEEESAATLTAEMNANVRGVIEDRYYP